LVIDPSSRATDLLQLVDSCDLDAGTATRGEVHSMGLPHRSVHVVVHDGAGRILVQKRSLGKDTSPGLWDISVGGHLDVGETCLEAALRECAEEIGLVVRPADLEDLGRHWFLENPLDRERVATWAVCSQGPFSPNPGEVDDLRFLDAPEVEAWIARGEMTASFTAQWRLQLQEWLASKA
jgi:isopentenyldiphosphate isomerase